MRGRAADLDEGEYGKRLDRFFLQGENSQKAVAIDEEDLRILSRLITKIFGFVLGLLKKKIQLSLLEPSTSPQVHTHENSL